MNFPYLISEIDDQLEENWKHRFSSDRSVRENVWRRHQSPENKELSLWGEDGIHRRRILFFHDKYGIVDNHFSLISSYVFVHFKSPTKEIENYVDKLIRKSRTGGWDLRSNKVLTRKDLVCEIKLCESHHFDGKNDAGYSNIDVSIYTNKPSEELVERPWKIFRTGIRKRLTPGNPTLINFGDLKRFFPAAVTLGCGPSIGAGIPPLNYLHKIYSLTKPNGKFVLKPEDDDFLSSFLEFPEGKYRETTFIHEACLKAKPTSFYSFLKELHDGGRVVGPIITNNFDGLCRSVGLPELYMRQFDVDGIYPDVFFHPSARSLFVIGSHADRRNVEASARKRGLPIVYIDPCGYEQNSSFIPYPLEAPQDGDFLLQVLPTTLSWQEF